MRIWGNFKMSGPNMRRVQSINSPNCWQSTTWTAAPVYIQTMKATALIFKRHLWWKKLFPPTVDRKIRRNKLLKWTTDLLFQNQNRKEAKIEGLQHNLAEKRLKCCAWDRLFKIRLGIEEKIVAFSYELSLLILLKALTLYKSQP